MGCRLLLWAAAALCIALGGCMEDAGAAERRALLRFRAGVSGWERMEAAVGPGGLPGWAADSPLPLCRWGGVSCCSISEDLADALGGSASPVAVCALKLVYQPLQAGQPPPGAGGRPATSKVQGGTPAAADLEPLRELPWLVTLELSGISVNMSSVDRLLQPHQPPLQLWSLVLRGAAFNAPLPPRLFKAPSVRDLDLSHSGVRGPLPPQRHCSLQSINLAGNWQLTGVLPQTLLLNPKDAPAAEAKAMSEHGTSFCDLLHLNLSSTGISGQLPELSDFPASALATLDLSNTQLGSTLPSSWPFHTPYLSYLDLTNASLRGEVPRTWWDDTASFSQRGPMTPEFLYLGGNQLTGSVPLRWAAIFTPSDGLRQRHKAAADVQGIEELQARMARHGPVTMLEQIKLRDVYITSYRLRYRSEEQTLSTALFPGNKGLCLQPDETLRLVEERAQSVPVYRTLLDRLCSSGGLGGGRGTVAGASLLVLMVVLTATVLLGAARLRHGSLPRAGKRWLRWWCSGYMPAQLDSITSQPCGKEGSRRSAAAAGLARSGGALPLNPRPGRRMGPVLQAIELAQASARAGMRREELELGGQQAQRAQQAEQQQQQQQADNLQLSGPLSATDAELPPLPLLPSTALVLPQHDGQPLMLGRTSRSMVMLGRLEGVGEVAVKALPISPQMLAVARREVRLLRRCANRHPNVVHLHGLCHTYPFLLVVTELCTGGDLQSLLHCPELRWHARGAQVALDVCRGVAFMHSQGVVWADCKPGNVLLTDSPGWRAKLTDLGTSRLLRGHSTAQSSATPAYAAPEQLLNGRVGLSSDIFSLGLLLHDLCTGEQPVLVGAEGRACYRRPLAPGRDCPEGLVPLIERCKAPLPADRPTAAAVVAALESLAAHA